MDSVRNSIVICAQHRKQELDCLLKCLNEIAIQIPVELIVVANSGLASAIEQIFKIVSQYESFASKKVVESKPGLTRSRNLGKLLAQGEFISFLDDDIEITADYFQRVEQLFSSDMNIVGASPFVEVDPMRWQSKSPLTVMRRKRELAGKITTYGRFDWLDFSETINQVEWLPGCAMTYRSSVIKDLIFNEELENGPSGGYALGEDADFSMRVSRLGKLVGLANVSILHKLSPVSRSNAEVMEAARGAWLAYLTRAFPTKFSKRLITIRLGMHTARIFLGIRNTSNLPTLNIRIASLRVRGFKSELNNPKLGAGLTK